MITVVMSVYNTGKYLAKAVDAMLAQTYRDFELFIIDDGSTDDSGAICDAQAARDDRFSVFHKPNGGLSSARNFGIEHAHGDFIIFPDPDDWVEANYLEQLLAIREREHADLSICGHYFDEGKNSTVWNAAAKPMVLDQDAALVQLMLPDSYCGYAWNKLYSMAVIRDNDLRFDLSLGMVQDLHFAYRYFQFCKVIAYDPTPVMHYNRDSSGVTTYDSPLTPRKMSGLKTYLKIAELAHDVHPKIEAMSLSILADTSLQYMYFYYHSHMHEPETLALLRETFATYFPYFIADDVYSGQRKLLGRIARVSPRLYYILFQSKRSLYDFFRKLAGKI